MSLFHFDLLYRAASNLAELKHWDIGNKSAILFECLFSRPGSSLVSTADAPHDLLRPPSKASAAAGGMEPMGSADDLSAAASDLVAAAIDSLQLNAGSAAVEMKMDLVCSRTPTQRLINGGSAVLVGPQLSKSGSDSFLVGYLFPGCHSNNVDNALDASNLMKGAAHHDLV